MPLERTESLCPVCLRTIAAEYRREGDFVILHKKCPDHGEFSAPAWKIYGSGPDFSAWCSGKRKPAYPARPARQIAHGCPHDCGLCPDHEQHTCVGLIEVTSRCSLGCPVCYAQATAAGGEGGDPSAEEISGMLDALLAASGPCHVQFSGGEPTERSDLPELVRLAKEKGFPLIQVNTNGLRLGREEGYARQLKNAGLDSVYLQFDGVDDKIYAKLRGRALLGVKLAALDACKSAGLGVVLVCTLVRGINDGNVGAMLDFAVRSGAMVRGMHFQPVSSFGRFPWSMDNAPRITLPELMRLIEEQTGGRIKASHFHPPSCEHPLCSFSAVFTRSGDGLLPEAPSSCCCGSRKGSAGVLDNAEGSRISRAFTAAHWRSPEKAPEAPANDFDLFLARFSMEKRFTISAMAFQDAFNADVRRLKTCCIHVVARDGRLIPFCACNMTSQDGAPLYRKGMPSCPGTGSGR